MRHPIKTSIAFIVFIFGFPIVSILLYFFFYSLINTLNPDAYFRYATDSRYSSDIFFSEAVKDGVNLEEILTKVIDKDLKVTRNQDLFAEMIKNEAAFKEALYSNETYMKYLNKHNLTVDDVISYAVRIVNLDEIFLHASIYLGILFLILVYYFAFKYRIRLYIIAGVTYLLIGVNTMTNGIFFDALFPSIVKLSSLFNDTTFSYEEYQNITTYMMPASREALLTFIIFDTVFKQLADRRQNRRLIEIKRTHIALENNLKILRGIVHKKNNLRFVSSGVQFHALKALCKKNKKDNHLKLALVDIEQLNGIDIRKTEPEELYNRYHNLYMNLKRSPLYVEKILTPQY